MLYFLDAFGSEGEMGEPCTASVHFAAKIKPKSTHYHTVQRHWVCFTCAQAENRFAIQNKAKPSCITGAEQTYKILAGSQ